MSEETRKKMSKAQSGKNNPMYGKQVSQETREKLRQANIGRKFTDEWKKKLVKQILVKNILMKVMKKIDKLI
jgi:hypothetical protein